jgi:hypothetical protein
MDDSSIITTFVPTSAISFPGAATASDARAAATGTLSNGNHAHSREHDGSRQRGGGNVARNCRRHDVGRLAIHRDADIERHEGLFRDIGPRDRHWARADFSR